MASRSFLHLFYLWLHALLFISSICGFALFYSSSLLSLVTSLLVLSSGYQLQSVFLSHFPSFRRLNQTSSPVVKLVVLLNPLFIHVKRSIWRSLLNLHLKPKINVAAASFFFNQELGCECSPICWLVKHSQRFHSALSKNYISIFSVPQNCWTKYKIVLQENKVASLTYECESFRPEWLIDSAETKIDMESENWKKLSWNWLCMAPSFNKTAEFVFTYHYKRQIGTNLCELKKFEIISHTD